LESLARLVWQPLAETTEILRPFDCAQGRQAPFDRAQGGQDKVARGNGLRGACTPHPDPLPQGARRRAGVPTTASGDTGPDLGTGVKPLDTWCCKSRLMNELSGRDNCAGLGRALMVRSARMEDRERWYTDGKSTPREGTRSTTPAERGIPPYNMERTGLRPPCAVATRARRGRVLPCPARLPYDKLRGAPSTAFRAGRAGRALRLRSGQGGPYMKITKRSQFLEVPASVDMVYLQRLRGRTVPFCRLASFGRNWLRLAPLVLNPQFTDLWTCSRAVRILLGESALCFPRGSVTGLVGVRTIDRWREWSFKQTHPAGGGHDVPTGSQPGNPICWTTGVNL
jgi:hypothetical protein